MPAFPATHAIVQRAIDEHVFPGAVVEVGTPAGVLWQEAFGRLTYAPDASPASVETLYDLASLTKVIATTTLVMRLVDDRRVDLSDAVSQWLPEWRGRDRGSVTIRQLLAHSAGLAPWRPLFRTCAGRDEFQRAICDIPLDYSPGISAAYSDLGFILLGFIVADAGGAPLDSQFSQVFTNLAERSALESLEPSRGGERPSPLHVGFLPPAAWCHQIAPTEIDPWRGRLLVGEVHDENCWALGGVAGHAGLFGTAPGVGLFARVLLSARLGRDGLLARRETVEAFTTRQPEPGSSRALGWDTMLPTSSCGTLMSSVAFGHTGFTGTSLWLDPVAGLYVVLLANRIHPSREGDAIHRIRPAVHDSIMEEVRAA